MNTHLTNHGAYIGAPKDQAEPEPEFTLPQPPPGIQWHRKDGWKAGDLPQGYRPLARGEKVESHARTTRPLTFTHLGQTWTWHKPGDLMPCDSKSRVCVLLESDTPSTAAIELLAAVVPWTRDPKIIGWRYAEPVTKTVQLGPSNIPPGSALKLPAWGEGVHVTPSVWRSGVSFAIRERVDQRTYEQLKDEGWLINRPANRDADGNPTKWEPCSKEVAA